MINENVVLIQQIYDLINYHNQLHYLKNLCEDRLKCRDKKSTSDEDDELDRHNCTTDDDQNESVIIHPRIVLPQSLTKKRLLFI
jgi:hypothetical protein